MPVMADHGAAVSFGQALPGSSFCPIPSVAGAPRVVAQQKTKSLPQASQVCLISSFNLNPAPVTVMVDSQAGQ